MRSSIAPKPVIEITSNKITYFWRLDKGYLEQEYIKNGKSMAQIAREKGCARSTVGKALDDFKLSTEKTERKNVRLGQIPYGFRVKHGSLVPHQGEKLVIEHLSEMKSKGSTYGQMVQWLNKQGVKTKNRANSWDRPTVYKILKREIDLPTQPS